MGTFEMTLLIVAIPLIILILNIVGWYVVYKTWDRRFHIAATLIPYMIALSLGSAAALVMLILAHVAQL
jgi:uncharacterized membrane protein YidH (DUF202 family)